MSEMRIVPDDMSFNVFEISKQRLKGLYKINTMEFKAVDNMDESDMETLAALIGYRIHDTMGDFDNILKETFKLNFATPFRDEAKDAADAIDYLLDYDPLNGDDIEQLVEQFKFELEERHGDK